MSTNKVILNRPDNSNTIAHFAHPWSKPYSYSAHNLIHHPINTAAMVAADALDFLRGALQKVRAGCQKLTVALFPYHASSELPGSFWSTVVQDFIHNEHSKPQQAHRLLNERPIIPASIIPVVKQASPVISGAIVPVIAARQLAPIGQGTGSLVTTALATQMASSIAGTLFGKVLGDQVSPYVLTSENPWDHRVQIISSLALARAFNLFSSGRYNLLAHLFVAAASTTPAVHLVQKYVPGAAALSRAAEKAAEKTKGFVIKTLIRPAIKHFVIPQLAYRTPKVLKWAMEDCEDNPFSLIQEAVASAKGKLSPGQQNMSQLLIEEGLREPTKALAKRQLTVLTDFSAEFSYGILAKITHNVALSALMSYFVGPVGLPGGRQLLALGMVAGGGLQQSPLNLITRVTAAGLYLSGRSPWVCHTLIAASALTSWYLKARHRFLKRHKMEDPALTLLKETKEKVETVSRDAINGIGNWVQAKIGHPLTPILATPEGNLNEANLDKENANAQQPVKKGADRPVGLKGKPQASKPKRKAAEETKKNATKVSAWKRWGRMALGHVLGAAVYLNSELSANDFETLCSQSNFSN